MQSPSLVIGRSYLPCQNKSTSNNIHIFVSRTVSVIKKNPDIAAEIVLAATDQLLDRLSIPIELKSALAQLIDESCKARDASTHA